MRRSGGVTLALLTVTVALAAGCAPGASLADCANVPDSVVETLNQRLTADGELRNARAIVMEEDGRAFVSVELHLNEDEDEEKGEVLTFVSQDVRGPDYEAVDENARTETSWPQSDVDMLAEGAVKSRGCAYEVRGPVEEDEDVNDLLDQFNR